MTPSQSSPRVAKAQPERVVRSGNNRTFLGGDSLIVPATLSL